MKLKVCGITNEADALAAAQTGVDYLGYVINYTASPRFILPQVADSIIKKIKPLFPKVQHVAVLVTPTKQFVAELEALSFDLYQMYGDIVASEKPVWKSIVMKSKEDLKQLESVQGVTAIHCDAGMGSGMMIDQRLLKEIKTNLSLIISGGVNVNNIQEIVTACHPDIIDVNSGVESAPGKKDIQKIHELQQLIFSN